MGIEEDSLRELKSLNQNIANLTRSLGKVGGSGSFGATQSQARDGRDDYDPNKKLRRGSKAFNQMDKAVAGYDSAAKKFMSSSGKLTSNIAEANDDLKALRESWQEGSDAMFNMKERIDKWGDSQTAMNSQTARIVAGMSRFTNHLAKATKAQSLLYAEQLTFINGFKDFEKAAYFDELSRSVGALTETAKRRLALVDKTTGALRSDLDTSDFKRVRTTIGEIESSIKEVLSGTDFKSFADLVDNGRFTESAGDGRSNVDATGAAMGMDKASINREAVTKIAAMLQAKGLFEPKHESQNVLNADGTLKNAAELNKIDWKGLAMSISATEQSFGRAAKQLDENVDIFNDKWGRLIQSLKNNEGRAASLDSLKSMAASFLSSGAAFKTAKDKIVQAYNEIQDFNIAQIPATYFEVNKASMSLGLSFKDTVKLMDENKRILAIYGPQKFTAAMGDMSKTFQKYGYTMEQAASMVGPTVESAISAGINIRDPGQLNSFTDNMMTQFQKVSGMVKISAQEFAQLNSQLFKSEGAFDTMLGLDVQRRQAYAQDLVQLRTAYVAKGLEIQQANELVKAQQEQQRGRYKDRTQLGANLMTAAQVAGLGADVSMEVYRLAGKKRTAEEDARFAELQGQIAQGMEAKTNQGYGANGMGAAGIINQELTLDLLPKDLMQKSASQMQMAKDAGAEVNPDEQKRAGDAAKGDATVAQLGQAVNKVSAIINSAFLGAIVSSSVALVAFGYQLTKVTGLMGGKGGLIGSLVDIGKGFLGKGKLPGTGGITGGAGAGAAEGAASGTAGAAGGASSWLGKAGGWLGKNAGMLGKATGIIGAGVAAISAFSDLSDVQEQKKNGEISNKQANVKSAGIVGGGAAGLIGAGIGQALIPIPGVGAIAGGAVGAALGSWLGKSVSEAVADAVLSDDKTKSSQPTTDTKTPVQQPTTQQPTSTPVTPQVPQTDQQKPVDMASSIAKGVTMATPTLASAIADAIKKTSAATGVVQGKAAEAQQPSSLSGVLSTFTTGIAAVNPLLGALMPATKALTSTASTMPDFTSILAPLSPLTAAVSAFEGLINPINMMMAKPVSGLPVAPATPKIGLDSAKDTSETGINTLAQDGTAVLGVHDQEAATQLEAMAQHLAQAVQYLQQLAQQQPSPGSLKAANNTAPTAGPTPMNTIPSAYEFATGRFGRST